MKRKKIIQPITRFSVDIYDSKIYVIFGDYTGIDKRLKKDKYELYQVSHIMSEIHKFKDEPDINGCVMYPCPYDFVIFFPYPKLQDITLVRTIAHECIHITSRIFTRVGATLSTESEECFTYLHGHIMSKVLDVIFE